MSDPVKKFGDARLASRVAEAMAEGIRPPQLDLFQCGSFEISSLKCVSLSTVISSYASPYSDSTMTITPKEKEFLEMVGFDKTFVDALAGPDGKRALRARVKWLADNVVTRWWRNDYNNGERAILAKNLGMYGPEEPNMTLPPLLEIVKEFSERDRFGDDEVRLVVAVMRGIYRIMETNPAAKSRAKEILPHLRKMLRKETFPLLFFPLFSKIGETPLLMEIIRTDRELRDIAIEHLRDHGKKGEEAIPLLLEIYREPNTNTDDAENTRETIVFTLLKIGEAPPEVIFLLKDYLESARGSLIKRTLIENLQTLGRPALPLLFPMLGKEDFVGAAATAISKMDLKAEDIVPLLESLPMERFPIVHLDIVNALVKIGPSAALPLAQALKSSILTPNWVLKPIWETACFALKRLGPAGAAAAEEIYALAISQIMVLRGDPSAYTSVFEILAGMEEEGLPLLLRGLENWRVKRHSLLAIGKMGTKARSALPHVLPFFNYPQGVFRKEVVSVLSRIAPDSLEIVRPVTLALNDYDRHVRRAALLALRDMTGLNPDIHLALPPLMEVMNNPGEAEDLRNLARDAIRKIEEGIL